MPDINGTSYENLARILSEIGIPSDAEIAQKAVKYESLLKVIPEKTIGIISDYATIMEELGWFKIGRKRELYLLPMSRLPHPEEKIEDALETALEHSLPEVVKMYLGLLWVKLYDFIPDDKIPDDPEEHFKLWSRRQKKVEQLGRIMAKTGDLDAFRLSDFRLRRKLEKQQSDD